MIHYKVMLICLGLLVLLVCPSDAKEKVVTTVTAYSLKESPNKVTATGTTPRHNITVAVSRSLEKIFPMGTKLKIEGFSGRIFVVEDRMSKRWKRYRLDIFFNSHKGAINFGIKKLKITKL